jgi:hypothetical protein
MSHHDSAVRLIAGRRRIYTGETASAALSAAHEASYTFTPDERRAVAKILAHDLDHGSGADSLQCHLGDRLRRVIVPDTASPLQWQLEAGILINLGRVVFHRRPGLWRAESARSAVRPSTAGLTMKLGTSTLAPVLAGLRLSGLRVVRQKRDVELQLSDGRCTAAVSLSAVAPRNWIAAARYARALSGAQWPIERGSVALAANPLPENETHPLVLLVGSRLLRRIGVLGTTSWLAVDVNNDALAVHLTWAGGRPAEEVLGHLMHRPGGLPAQHFSVHRQEESLLAASVHLGANRPCVDVVLHSLPTDMPPPSLRLETEPAWEAFDHALTQTASSVRAVAS